jgi:glutamine synthetase
MIGSATNAPKPLAFASRRDLAATARAQGAAMLSLTYVDAGGALRCVGVEAGALPDRGAFAPAGWGGPALEPDLAAVVRDPFAAQGTLKVWCGAGAACPRAALARAAAHLAATGAVDDLEVAARLGFVLAGPDDPPGAQAACADAPQDATADIRAEIVTVARAAGVPAAWHHAAAGRAGAGAVGLAPLGLARAGDALALLRWVAENVAASYGRRAVLGGPGTLALTLRPMRRGKPAAPEAVQHALGGLLRHAPALHGLLAPSGGAAPVTPAGWCVRDADAGALTLPHGAGDAAAHLALAALALAAAEGVANRAQPGEPGGEDDAAPVGPLPAHAHAALDAVEADRPLFDLGGKAGLERWGAAYVAARRAAL